MFHHTRVTIFQEHAKPNLLELGRDFHPPGSVYDTYGVMMWTEPAAQGEAPGILVLNTKLERRVYQLPRLIEIHGGAVMFAAFTESEPSGTLRRIETVYIVVREYHPA